MYLILVLKTHLALAREIHCLGNLKSTPLSVIHPSLLNELFIQKIQVRGVREVERWLVHPPIAAGNCL